VFSEVKSTAKDLRVELEVKKQLDKDASHSSPVIEVGGQRDMSINNSAEASMTKFWEVQLQPRIQSRAWGQKPVDKNRTYTNSEVGEGKKELKDKWTVEFKEDETIALIEVGGQERAEAQAEIGAEKAALIKLS
jgi:hypothetical protein